MTRERYQESLDTLRDDITEMGAVVVERLEQSLQSLRTRDETLAQSVIEGDDDINERYLAIESQCVELFALQQPVASDLRFILAAFKISTDLERIGDLATNLGRYALGTDRGLAPDVAIEEIGEMASTLVRESLDAFAAGDADACPEIAAADDELDALCQRASNTVVRGLVERESGDDNAWAFERLLDDVSRVLLTVRDLERVGDHAVNIAARTLYMVENDSRLIY